MPRGPTGDDPDPSDSSKLFRRQSDIRQIRLAGLVGVASAHRVENRLRLFVNLLQHEVRESALFCRGGIPGNLSRLSFDRTSLDIGEMDIRRGHNRHIALFKIDHVTGMGEHGHDIGGDERCIGGCAHNQRTPGTRRDHRPRFPLRNDGERITPSHILRGSSHRYGQRHALLKIFVDQMRDDLRVRFRLKLVALFFQLLFQRLIVFDDAVVHEHAAFRAVRVGVLLRGLPVRRPSRVANSHGALECFLLERLLKISQFADAAPDFNRLPLQHRNTG